MKKYFLKTFGCEMNQADSEKIHMILLQAGCKKTSDYTDADIIILNTCSVRQKWENRVFWLLHEIEKINQWKKEKWQTNSIVWITGCMVRKTGLHKKYLWENITKIKIKKIELIEKNTWILNADDDLFSRVNNFDFTIRIEEIKYLNLIFSHIYWEKIGNDDKFDDYLKQTQLRENKFSASVIIQTGCDNFCTFCIVPYTRWKEVSREKNEIIEEIQKLAQNGTKEISLIGQNVNSYGKQQNLSVWNKEKSSWNDWFGISPFRKLLNDINNIEWINRIRFTSSNPHDMTQDILDAHFDLEKTCHYLHFALQSGNDEILKKMNRRHTYLDFKNMVLYLRNKDPYFSISTDIIVGYSGETDEMFQDTVNAIRELEIDYVYIARYSVRTWTLASKLYPDDISESVKAERWHILNSVLEENVKKRGIKMIWAIEEILISWEKEEQFYGRTRNFKEVFFFKKENIQIGDIVNVKIIWIQNWVLIGEVI